MANIRDVAARAGVSVATVSHVLNNTKPTRPETEARVRAAVEKLGYVQNAAARQLAVGKSNLLGIVISDIRNPFFPEIVTAFQDRASLAGVDTVLMNTNYDVERTRTCVDRLLGLRVPGVAVLTSQIEPSVIETLANHEVAAVYIELGRADRWISNIVVDDGRGIEEALDHLDSLGHRKVAFIGGPDPMVAAHRRASSFTAGAERRGWETQVVESDLTVPGGYAACGRIWSGFRPTAICTANDLQAIGAMRYAHEHGIALPAELSIVGFDDIDFAQSTYPPLTTVAQDRHKIGETAFEALSSLMAGEDSQGAEYRIGTELIVRGSTGPAPSGDSEQPV